MYAVRYGTGGALVWGCFHTPEGAAAAATALNTQGHTAYVFAPGGGVTVHAPQLGGVK